MLLLPDAVIATPHLARRSPGFSRGDRLLAAEIPVALSYNRATHAVMMATPDALEDFAVGFSLSEGIVAAASDILDVEVMVVKWPVDFLPS